METPIKFKRTKPECYTSTKYLARREKLMLDHTASAYRLDGVHLQVKGTVKFMNYDS